MIRAGAGSIGSIGYGVTEILLSDVEHDPVSPFDPKVVPKMETGATLAPTYLTLMATDVAPLLRKAP